MSSDPELAERARRELREALRKGGGTGVGAAKVLGVSYRQVLRWLESAGIELPKRPPQPSNAAILRAAKQAGGVAAAAAELGVNRNALARWADERGLSLPDARRKPRK